MATPRLSEYRGASLTRPPAGWPTALFSATSENILFLNSLDFYPSAPLPIPIPEAGMPVLPPATPSCLASAGSAPILPQGRCATSSSRPFDNSTAGVCRSHWCVEHSGLVGFRRDDLSPLAEWVKGACGLVLSSLHIPLFHLTVHVGGGHLTGDKSCGGGLRISEGKRQLSPSVKINTARIWPLSTLLSVAHL